MLRRFALVVVLVLFCHASAYAEAKIKPCNRLSNKAPGVCAWVSVEMIGKELGLKSLKHLTDDRFQIETDYIWDWPTVSWKGVPGTSGYMECIKDELNRRNVKYRAQESGDENILYEARRLDLPCVVGFRAPKGHTQLHAVVLLDLGPSIVKYCDPNTPEETLVVPRSWFEDFHNNWALLIYPPETK